MDNLVEQYSPDKNFKLTFYDFEEPRMGMDICKFSLTNLQTNEIIKFTSLWAIGIGQQGFSWSEDQNIFSLPLVNPPKDSKFSCNFFIYNIGEGKFTAIHFPNCYVLLGHCHDEYIEIEYDDHIPGDILMYPTKDLVKPHNIKFSFSKLQWTDIDQIQQFDVLNSNAVIHKFQPIDNGWRPFKGRLPETTEILIWRLKQFAEYGDTQSIEWFAEIQKITNKIDYWVDASYYLGLKTRAQ